MKVLCIGDSLTYGSVGYSYVPFLPVSFKTINKGVNGDTLAGAFRRLRKYLRTPRYADIDALVVGIGTNDLLLPHIATLSPVWKNAMAARAIEKICRVEDEAFFSLYEAMMRFIKWKGVPAVLLGMPQMEMAGFPMERLRRRNAGIAALAKGYGFAFVDTCSLQHKLLQGPPGSYRWEPTQLQRFADGAAMGLLPFVKDRFARRRKLQLTVDGVHFNSASAKALAGAVEEKLNAIQGQFI